MSSFHYLLDHRDRLTGFGSHWDAQALRNSAPELLGERLLGTELFGYVSGAAAQAHLAAAFDAARRAETPVQLDYRCDTRSHARNFRMEVFALGDGRLGVKHRLLGVAPFARAALDLTDAGDRRLEVCANCCRVSDAGAWRETGRAPTPPLFRNTSRICPDCHTDRDRAIRRAHASPGIR